MALLDPYILPDWGKRLLQLVQLVTAAVSDGRTSANVPTVSKTKLTTVQYLCVLVCVIQAAPEGATKRLGFGWCHSQHYQLDGGEIGSK